MDYTLDDLDRIGKRWLEKIKAAEKREDKWIKDAENAEAAYTVDGGETNITLPSFNILHSNVETIVPSIINSAPAPDIRPRHGVADQVTKEVADVYERAVNTQIDDNALDEEMEASAQDAFMAGRGIIRLKFEADVQEMVAIDPETGEETEAPPQVSNERVLFEVVSWRDYREGPAKRWETVPWICFRHEISEDERERLENEDFAALYAKEETENNVSDDLSETVWEIWDKAKREVLFIVEDSGKVLDITDDPLGLKTFYPIAKPVQPIMATGKRTPVCPYAVYETLAKELDRATERINKIMLGLKVRGVIAGDATAIEAIAEAGDNEVVPVANIENLVAAGGLDRAVMWWPVDMAVQVLQQLYVQREQIKQTIYEITGISDIVRGASSAGETATAQQIKTEWGSLRIKKMQKLIQRQARDIIKLAVEIMNRHFSVQTLQKAAGVQLSEQAAMLLEQPLDHFRIDIETDSTIRADLTKSRDEMSRFLEGTAQFFSTMAPIVAQAPKAGGPLAAMYGAFARQFSLGKTAEDALDEFVRMADEASKQPQDKPNPEMEMKLKEMEGKYLLEVEKLKLQAKNLEIEAQIKSAELMLKREELGIKANDSQLAEAKAEADVAARFVELDMEQEQERPVKIGN